MTRALRAALVSGALGALAAASPAAAIPFKQHAQAPAAAGGELPPALEGVEIRERLGERVPADATFTGADGRPLRLGDVLARGRPVVLSLVYYDCPMLCGLLLGGAARAMGQTGLALGRDYEAVTLSFAPRETTRQAAERQRGYLQAVGRPDAAAHWPFLTGEEPEIRKVTAAVGFGYAYDEKTRQYAHPAALFVLSPDGRVSRYLYGIDFPARDLRLALVEAGEGRVGTSFDKLLLTCYRYDPSSRRYEPYVVGFIRVAGLSILGAVAVTLALFWRREVRRGTVR